MLSHFLNKRDRHRVIPVNTEKLERVVEYLPRALMASAPALGVLRITTGGEYVHDLRQRLLVGWIGRVQDRFFVEVATARFFVHGNGLKVAVCAMHNLQRTFI